MPDMGRGIIAPANNENIVTGAAELRTLASTAALAISELAHQAVPRELSNVDLNTVRETMRGYGSVQAGVTNFPPALAGSRGLFTSTRISSQRTHHEWMTALGTVWKRTSNADGTWQEWSLDEDPALPEYRVFTTQAEAQRWESEHQGGAALYLGRVQ